MTGFRPLGLADARVRQPEAPDSLASGASAPSAPAIPSPSSAGSSELPLRVEGEWYRKPGGSIHALARLRTVCGRHYWTAAWHRVTNLRQVPEDELCPVCADLVFGWAPGELEAEYGR